MFEIIKKLFRRKNKPAPRGRTGGEMKNFGGGTVTANTELVARHLRKKPGSEEYEEIDRRTVKDRCITDDFVEDIVDNLIAEVSAFGDYKYHDSGTGVAGELATDAALQTPCGEARTIGSQVEGTTKQYKSVATHTYAGTFAITEHGLFNAAAAGILMDRTVFGAINVVATDKIEFTFTITFNSGG